MRTGPTRTGRAWRSSRHRAKTDFHGVDMIGPDARHFLNGPRPTPVQSRLEILVQRPAEAADDGHFIGRDLRQPAQDIASECQRAGCAECCTPLMAQPVEPFAKIETPL